MKNVFVGISGGVDSAVAALLLKNQGYNVTGVFLKNWSGEDYGVNDQCPWKEDLESANKVAEHLNIPLKVYNFEKEYRELVIKDFFYQYSIGNTPNPDILCNKFIKFDKFLEKALEEGADYIATGHYSNTQNERLYKAKDNHKDQTYFLHQLTKEQLGRSIFPLGDLTKPEVREIAAKYNLPNAERKDSQGICFVGKVDIEEFLKQELKQQNGDILDIDTNQMVGKHIGVWFYTIGQRQGLRIGGSDKPYFVAKKDIRNNILYVAKGKEHTTLYGKRFEIAEFHTINNINALDENKDYTGVIRYRAREENVRIQKINENSVVLSFDKQMWAPAIGQSAVIFDDTECIGGGVITKIL